MGVKGGLRRHNHYLLHYDFYPPQAATVPPAPQRVAAVAVDAAFTTAGVAVAVDVAFTTADIAVAVDATFTTAGIAGPVVSCGSFFAAATVAAISTFCCFSSCY